MGAATGLGQLDVAILEACEESGGMFGSFVKSRTVLETLHERTGIGPRVAYEPLCDLARPWVLNLTLLEFQGNFGSPDGPPASPRYTECCLSQLGGAALAAERGEIGPVPIGLINGTTHVDGRWPPLDPSRVAAAIRAAAGGEVSDHELVRIVGQPSFPTGCDVDVDLALLSSGADVEIEVSARIEFERDHLVISRLPPASSPELVEESIVRLVHNGGMRDRQSEPSKGPPRLRGVRNETTRLSGSRVVVEPLSAADVGAAAVALFDLWPVRRSIAVRFGQPMAAMIRDAAASRGGLEERLVMIEKSARY